MTTKIGSELLSELLQEMEAAEPEMMPPTNKHDDDDKVIAIVTDLTIKKAWGIHQIHRREEARLGVEATFINEGEREQIKAECRRHSQMADVYIEIVWLLCREIHQCWDYGCIGLREGWELVSHKHDDPKEAIIKKLFGGLQ